jgi:S1-C subfamily serine protease
VIERWVLGKLVNQEGITLLMATLGVTYFLDGAGQTLFGSDIYKIDVGLPKDPIFLLENVFQPSPASAAGLQVDDFLTHFAGVEIHAPVDFQRQLYLAGVGRAVELRFFRAGQTFERTVTIEKRPAAAQPR